MAVELASAYVQIIPSFKGMQSSIKKELDGTSPTFARAGQESGSRFKSGFAGMAAKAGGLFAVAGVAAFAKGAITAASDVAESASKVGVVFGDQSKQIVAASKTSATAMGLSSGAYLEATGTLGNLLVSLNIAPKAAAKMSQEMVKLAGDLASFNNVSPEEALAAIKSGLTGETEPLKAFGVNMNDATLHAEALKLGLIKTIKDGLSPQVKALAAQSLIMSQTGTAQGDFARTSSGLANQQRILAAQFEDVKAKLGAQLLPVIKTFVGFLTGTAIPAVAGFGNAVKSVGGFLKDHKDAVELAAAATVGLFLVFKGAAIVTAVLKAISIAYQTMAGAALYAKDSVMAANTSMSAGKVAGAGLTLVLVAALAVWQQHNKEVAAAKARVQEYTGAIKEDSGAIGSHTRAQLADKLASEGVFEAGRKYGLSIATITAAALGNVAAIQQVIAATKGHFGAATGVLGPILQQNQAIGDNVRNYKDAKVAIDGLTPSIDKTAVATQGLNDKVAGQISGGKTAVIIINGQKVALREQATAADVLTAALSRLSGDANAAAESQLAFSDGLLGITDAIKSQAEQFKDSGTSLKENTQEGNKNLEWLHQQIDAINNVASAQQKANVPLDQVTAKMGANEKALRDSAVAAGLNATEVDNLIKKYAATPTQVKTAILADTTPSQRKLLAAKAQLDELTKLRTATVKAETGLTGPALHQVRVKLDDIDAKIASARVAIDGVPAALSAIYSVRDALGSLVQYRQVGIQVGKFGQGVGANAAGTDNWRGGLTWVGERGPELLNLPPRSQIASHNDSMAMVASGGGGVIHLESTIVLDSKVVGKSVTEYQLANARRS